VVYGVVTGEKHNPDKQELEQRCFEKKLRNPILWFVLTNTSYGVVFSH